MPNTQSETRFTQQVSDQLKAIVGSEFVCTSSEDLDRYSRCTIPWQKRCAAVVFPGSGEEVSRVIKLAGEHGLTIWPFSTGKNWGYGASLATEDGAIVLILERMNRVLEVNEELAYVVIEPGVSYQQLNAYLRETGSRLWADCTDGPPEGSVIGNALERGIGETPYGDHFGNLCGLEVVLPTGELVQIGTSSKSQRTWHTHKWGLGPYIEGLFSQSNLGVVTQAGLWLMPEPEEYNSYVFEIRNEADVPAVMDAYRKLALLGVAVSKLHMINDFVTITVLTQRLHEDVPSKGRLSAADLDGLRHKYRISPWSCGGGLYGTREQVKVQRKLLRRELGPYGRLIFLTDGRLSLLDKLVRLVKKNDWMLPFLHGLGKTSLPVLELAPHAHRILKGIPTEYFVRHAYYRHGASRPDSDVDPAADRCGLIWFAPILPVIGAEIVRYLADSRKTFEEYDFDFYVAMLMMNPRSVVCLMAIIYDKESPDEVERAKGLYARLVQDMQAVNLQQYRAGLAGGDSVYRGAPELKSLNGRIKKALDPKGVIAPGRYDVGSAMPASGVEPTDPPGL